MLALSKAALPHPARCTCGYTKFATRVDRIRESHAMRWRRIPPAGGLGSVIVGGTLGAAQPGWGRYEVETHVGLFSTYCESCARTRRTTIVGGGMPIGTWADDTHFYALMTDVIDPGCATARFSLLSGAPYDVVPELVETPILADPGSPLEVLPTPPPGAVLATLIYRVAFPEVVVSGTYVISLVDRCIGVVTRMGTAALLGDP